MSRRKIIVLSCIGLIVVLIIVFFIGIRKSKLVDLHIHAKIHADGSATITETRNTYITRGSELYIVIGDLGLSEIENFVVREGEQAFEYEDYWDTKKSRLDKTHKYGIRNQGFYYELIWGIGDYGLHEYVVQYDVTNFIKQVEDNQMIFWQFVNQETNLPPKNMTVEIEAERPLTVKTDQIWAFGYRGQIDFEDGKIVATSDKSLNRDDYTTILVQLPLGSFQTEDILDETFSDVKETAFLRSDYGEQDVGPVKAFWEVLSTVLILGLMIGIPIAVIRFVIRLFVKIKHALWCRKVTKDIKGLYNRDLPKHYAIGDVFYLLKQRSLANESNLISAYILKWIHAGYVSIETVDWKRGRKKTVLYFHERKVKLEGLEIRLYNILTDVAGESNRLEQYDSESWHLNAQDKLYKWKRRINKKSEIYLTQRGYIEPHAKKLLVTEKGEKLQKEIFKFLQYLDDFSLLEERDAIHVSIWDNVMIWAALLGVTDKVGKQLSDMYPEYDLLLSQQMEGVNSISSYVSYKGNGFNTRSASGSGNLGSGGGGGGASRRGGGGSFGGGRGGGFR